MAKKPKTTALFTDRPLCYRDLADLRDRLGLPSLDFAWQMGMVHRKWSVEGAAAETPIANPSMTLLVRYLMHHPDKQFVPRLPSAEDVHQAIDRVASSRRLKNLLKPPSKVEPKGQKTLSSRRFSPLFGAGAWSGSRWLSGERVSPAVSRLFFLVLRAIEEDGERGLNRFLDVVDEEARARGIEGGLEELLTSAMWGAYREGKEDKED